MIPDPFIRERSGADPLIEGYYLLSLARAGRVSIPVRVWFGPPRDPETLEELDRSHRWQIQVGFRLLEDEPLVIGGIRISDITDVWPRVARDPIDEVDWRYRLARAEWAVDHDENDPFSQLGGRIDPMTCSLP